MKEQRYGLNGSGCKIKMGQVFGAEGISFSDLPEDYGVVITNHNGLEVAYGDAWDMNNPHEREILEKNFVGAKMQHGDHAFLIKKEKGEVIRQKKKSAKIQPKIPSVVPTWKHNRWNNFGQAGDVAARRG